MIPQKMQFNALSNSALFQSALAPIVGLIVGMEDLDFPLLPCSVPFDNRH
jgi:hypothetical protein